MTQLLIMQSMELEGRGIDVMGAWMNDTLVIGG